MDLRRLAAAVAVAAIATGPPAVAGQPLTYSEMLAKPLSPRSLWERPPTPGVVPSADAPDSAALPEGVARWMDGAAVRGRPWTQHDYTCLNHIAGNPSAEPPEKGACANDGGKNILCEAECPVALQQLLLPEAKNCSKDKDVITAFCNNEIHCDKQHGCSFGTMFSPQCHAKLLHMIDLAHPPKDSGGRRLQPGRGGKGKGGKAPSAEERNTFQALQSWSTHMGIKGHFYQCVALDDYYFWQAHFQCNGEKPPLGYQSCYGRNQYMDLEMDLCVPTECNNQFDVRGIANAYAEYGLDHSWLDFQYAHEPMAPPLDAIGYHGVPMVVTIVVLAALCILATLASATGRDWLGLTGCDGAIPMEANVTMRAKKLLDARGSVSCSEMEATIKRMTRTELWQFVQDGESAATPTSTSTAAPNAAAGTAGNSLQGAALAVPLMSDQLNESVGGSTGTSTGGGSSKPLMKPPSASSSAVGDGSSFLYRALLCWDMGGNFRTGLCKQDGGVPEMRILNGLRVLSMGWVVLGHTYLYMNQMAGGGVANEGFDETVQARLPTILISNGQFSVDTFFVLSGFLGAYVGLRKLNAMDKAGKKVPAAPALALTAFIDRWLRLTPLYFFMLMIYMFLIPHLLTGPAATWDAATEMDDYTGPNRERDGSSHNGIGGDYDFCKTYLWTNLLYVTNYYPNQFVGSMKIDHSKPDWYKHIGQLGCMGHSWYLSVDFQLHLLTPWLLSLFRWRPNAAYLTMVSMILGSFGYLLFLVVHANYNMCEAGVGAQRSGDHFEGNENTLEYNKPWTRCGPFLLGVLLACYQSQHSNRAGHIPAPSTLAIILGYLLSLAVMAVYVFSPWWARNHHGLDGGNWMDGTCEWSRGWDAFYIITRRTAWGGAVTYLIYAALVCKGGPITRFLSWNFWTPFARLTYGWYLCHPLWMSIIFRSNPNPLNFYDLLGVAYYITNCVVGLLISIACFFLVRQTNTTH